MTVNGAEPAPLTASAFNQLGQCLTVLVTGPRRFFSGSGRNNCQYWLRYPRRDGQAELAWVA